MITEIETCQAIHGQQQGGLQKSAFFVAVLISMLRHSRSPPLALGFLFVEHLAPRWLFAIICLNPLLLADKQEAA